MSARSSSLSPPLSAAALPDADAELLARFVRDGDGAAFSALVERHLNLVFGVACRRTESRELAQEAAQNTFCQLARHAARVRIRESLAPWLHKVALRESGTLLRAERSRRRAMERLAESMADAGSGTASTENGQAGFEDSASASYPASISGAPASSFNTGAGFSTGTRAGEHLDEALASLPEDGRRVLILRYLQGLSLRELAAVESASEEAVRKRVTRALDRLTALLARRGVTASAMMGCLTHVPLWPAPPPGGMAARAVREAAAASAPAGLSLSALAASCWPMAAVFLAAAISAALPWNTGIPPAFGGNNAAAVPAFTASSPGSQPGSADKPGQKILTPAVMAGLQRDLAAMQSQEFRTRDMRMRRLNLFYRRTVFENSLDPVKWAAIQRLIADLPAEEIKASEAGLLKTPGGGLIAETLFARWAELSPEEARQAALEHACKSETGNAGALQGVVSVMAREDLAGTLRWIKASAPESCREKLLKSLTGPLAAQNPRAYLQYMSDPAMAPGDPGGAGAAAVPGKSSAAPEGALCDVLPYDPELALNGLRQRELEGSLSPRLYPLEESVVGKGGLSSRQLDTIAAFAENLPANSKLRQSLLRNTGILLADSQPARAADLMMAARAGSGRPDRYWLGSMGALIRDWQDRDLPASLHWLSAHEDLDLDPDALASLARGNRLQLPAKTKTTPVNVP